MIGSLVISYNNWRMFAGSLYSKVRILVIWCWSAFSWIKSLFSCMIPCSQECVALQKPQKDDFLTCRRSPNLPRKRGPLMVRYAKKSLNATLQENLWKERGILYLGTKISNGWINTQAKGIFWWWNVPKDKEIEKIWWCLWTNLCGGRHSFL